MVTAVCPRDEQQHVTLVPLPVGGTCTAKGNREGVWSVAASLTTTPPPDLGRKDHGVVRRTGPVPLHADRGSDAPIGHTVLHYVESRATDPPDVMVIYPAGAAAPAAGTGALPVGAPVEHAIVAGLRLTIPVNAPHEVISTDARSLRILVPPHVSSDLPGVL